MTWIRSSLALVAMVTPGCGDDGSASGSHSTGGIGGTTSSTTSTGGTGGTGGAGGGAPTCAGPGSGAVFGTLAGQMVDEQWQLLTTGTISMDPFWAQLEFAGRGIESFRGTQPGDPFGLPPGTYPLSFGAIRAPTTSALAGQAICFAEGTLDVQPGSANSVRSDKALLLGACPGTPVAGEVTLCNGCANAVTGDIEGTTPGNDMFNLFGGGDSYPEAYLQLNTADLFVRAFTDKVLDPSAGTSGNIESAILFTYPESDFGGAVYCAGAGSTFELGITPGVASMTLKNLSKLGTCAPGGDDSLLLCR